MSSGSAMVSDTFCWYAANSVGSSIMTTCFCSSTFIMLGGAALGPFEKNSAGITSKGANSLSMGWGCLVKTVNARTDATDVSSQDGWEELGVGAGMSNRAGSINVPETKFMGVWLADCLVVV